MKTELPTGTVTFLFTNVEGSTKLLHSFGSPPDAQPVDLESALRIASSE